MVREVLRAVLLSGLFSLRAGPARADKVHLVGGSIIEGRATRANGKVLIELETGTLCVSAREVESVERTPSELDKLDEQRAALPATAVTKRIMLANAYHDAGFYTRERALLREVIALDTNHAEARERLGFVRGPHGWLPMTQPTTTAESTQREQTKLELTRIALTQDAAALALQRAQIELEHAELERAKTRAEAHTATTQRSTVWVGSSWWQPAPTHPPTVTTPQAPSSAPFQINGVRSPQSYFDAR